MFMSIKISAGDGEATISKSPVNSDPVNITHHSACTPAKARVEHMDEN